MKKRYKLLKSGKCVFILRWVADGKLFGPDWEESGRFDNNAGNIERCKAIIRLMNECDRHTNHPNENDGE